MEEIEQAHEELNKKKHKQGPKAKIAKILYLANGVRAMDMRNAGMSWPEIAEVLGIDGPNAENTVLKMARTVRERIEEETAQELRAIHHARYEFMYRSLLPKIANGRERAIEVGAKVLENDAKLMGINADAESQTGSFQPILIQIKPHPNDPEAIKLAKTVDSQPKLLPAPDQST